MCEPQGPLLSPLPFLWGAYVVQRAGQVGHRARVRQKAEHTLHPQGHTDRMLKRFAERYTRKRDDEVWSVYESHGPRSSARVNWMHAVGYHDAPTTTGPMRGYILLSTDTLIFQVGTNYVEWPLKDLLAIDWDTEFETLTILHFMRGPVTREYFSLAVSGQGGPYGLSLRRLFANQLAEAALPIWKRRKTPMPGQPPVCRPGQ